jgi:hypothetical protein
VTITASNDVAKIYDLKKTGIGNLKIMYDVDPYNIVVISNGIFLSFLSEIDQLEIMFLRNKRGSNATGIRILFTSITRNKIFFTLKGRYPYNVGAENIITNPYRGSSQG